MNMVKHFNLPLGVIVIRTELAFDIVPKFECKSFRERWLSWPWEPWRGVKLTEMEVPAAFYSKFDNKIFAHPTLYDHINSEIRDFSK